MTVYKYNLFVFVIFHSHLLVNLTQLSASGFPTTATCITKATRGLGIAIISYKIRSANFERQNIWRLQVFEIVEWTEHQTLVLQVNNFPLSPYEFFLLNIHFSITHLLFTQIQVFSKKVINYLVPNKLIYTMLWASSSF